jgi:hypothetical protein
MDLARYVTELGSEGANLAIGGVKHPWQTGVGYGWKRTYQTARLSFPAY